MSNELAPTVNEEVDSELLELLYPETLTALPSIRDLLKKTLRVLRLRAKSIFAVAFAMGVTSLLVDLLSWLAREQDNLGVSAFMVVILLGCLVLSLWSETTLLVLIKNSPWNISIQEAFSRAVPLIFPVWIVGVLVGILSGVGFILLIIPGIIFAVWYSFAQYVAVNEGAHGMQALSISREYVRGHWWDAFLYSVAIFIPAICLVLFFYGIFYFASEALPLGEPAILLIEKVWELVTTYLLLLPFSIVYGYLLYTHFKALKEHQKEAITVS